MNTLPEEIRIGPYSYRVTESDDDVENEDGSHCVETLSIRSQEIRLAMDQAPICLRDSLLHEVLHGILNLTAQLSSNQEERIVGQISALLLDTLRRNPDLVSYLVSDDE